MKMKRLKGFVLATLVSGGVVFASAALALAPCDQVVVDTAGVLHNIPGIEAAAAKLAAATGAEVRVRIEPSFRPEANLDFHVEAITDNVCKAWTNFNQHRRENLILIWVTNNSDSRSVGLYYGDMWAADLGRAWPKIQEQKIKPLLRVGDYDAAFIAGLNAVSDTIVQAEQPAPPVVTERRQPVAPMIVERAPVTTVVQTAPTDWTPFAWVIALLIAALTAVFGGNRLYSLYTRQAREEAERLAVQQQAVEAYKTGRNLLEDLNRLDTEYKGKEGEVSPFVSAAMLKTLQAQYEVLSDTGLNLKTRFDAIANPDYGKPSTAESGAALASLSKLVAELQAVNTSFHSLKQSAIKAEGMAQAIPEAFAAMQANVSAWREQIASVTKSGFVTTKSDTTFAGAEAVLRTVSSSIEKKDWDTAEQSLFEAGKQFKAAIAAAEELPQIKRRLETRVAEVKKSLADFSAKRDNAKFAFTTMQGNYAEAAYHSVVGNGSEAEVLQHDLLQLIEASLADIQSQDWKEAAAKLAHAVDVWEQIETLLLAVVSLRDQLVKTKKAAEDEVAEAKRSIVVAENCLSNNPKFATAKYRSDLDEAARLVSEAEALAQATLPDVVRILALATKADAFADDTLALTQDAVAQAKRQAERAERMRQDALGRVDEVRQYLASHRSDVSSTESSRLNQIEAELATLRRHTDVQSIIMFAGQVTGNLDGILQSAKRSVSDAENRREERRREERRAQEARDAAAAAIRRSHNSSSSSSSSRGFGGGSSSFSSGSSRGFGGGSSSW